MPALIGRDRHPLHPFAGITRIRVPAFRQAEGQGFRPAVSAALCAAPLGDLSRLSEKTPSGNRKSRTRSRVKPQRFFQSSKAWRKTSSPLSPFSSVTRARRPVT